MGEQERCTSPLLLRESLRRDGKLSTRLVYKDVCWTRLPTGDISVGKYLVFQVSHFVLFALLTILITNWSLSKDINMLQKKDTSEERFDTGTITSHLILDYENETILQSLFKCNNR